MDNTVEPLCLQVTNVPVAQNGSSNFLVTERPRASTDDQEICVAFYIMMHGGDPNVSLTQGHPPLSSRTPPGGCEREQGQPCSISESTALGDPSVVPPHERQESARNVPFGEQPQPSPCDQFVVFSPSSITPPRSYTSEHGQDQYLGSESAFPNLRQLPRFARKLDWSSTLSSTMTGQQPPLRDNVVPPPPLFSSSAELPRFSRKNKRASKSTAPYPPFERTPPRRYETPPSGYVVLPLPHCDVSSIPNGVEVPDGTEKMLGPTLVERRQRDRYRAEMPYAGRETIVERQHAMKIHSIVNPGEGWGSEGQRAIYVPRLSLGTSDARDGGQEGVGTSASTVPCFDMAVDGGESVVVEEVPNWAEGMRSLPLALRRERRVIKKRANLSKPGSSKRVNRKNDHTPLIQDSSTSVQCVEPPNAGRTSTPEDLSTDHESTPRPTLVQRTGKSGARKRRETKPYEKKENTGKARGRYLNTEQRKLALENDHKVLAYSIMHARCNVTGVSIKLDNRHKRTRGAKSDKRRKRTGATIKSDNGRTRAGEATKLDNRHKQTGVATDLDDKCTDGLYYDGFWKKHKRTCNARANKEALDKDKHLVKETINPYRVECAGCGKTVKLHSKEKRKQLKAIKKKVDELREAAQENVTQEERDSYVGKEEAPPVEEEMKYEARRRLCGSSGWYATGLWEEHKKACTGGRGLGARTK